VGVVGLELAVRREGDPAGVVVPGMSPLLLAGGASGELGVSQRAARLLRRDMERADRLRAKIKRG
jgi:hypothetical protein